MLYCDIADGKLTNDGNSVAAYSSRYPCQQKRESKNGVPVRDYKKTKNILMGTPASESVKRVQKNLSSFLLFSDKE